MASQWWDQVGEEEITSWNWKPGCNSTVGLPWQTATAPSRAAPQDLTTSLWPHFLKGLPALSTVTQRNEIYSNCVAHLWKFCLHWDRTWASSPQSLASAPRFPLHPLETFLISHWQGCDFSQIVLMENLGGMSNWQHRLDWSCSFNSYSCPHLKNNPKYRSSMGVHHVFKVFCLLWR